MQFVTAEDPAGELESDGQVMHVEIDVALTPVEYVDALQSMQSDSASLLSVLRYVPGGQSTQAELPAPSANVPATQLTQVEAPTVANFPASHILQFVPTCSYPARQVKMVQLASQDVSHPPQP